MPVRLIFFLNLCVALVTTSVAHAQSTGSKADTLQRDWSYLDPQTDSVAGISLHKAYDLLKGKTSTPVVVGVLDSGVDPTHEDLKNVLWVNPKEVAGNQTDDDKNGYVDDVNGWNFMGGPGGDTYEFGQPEITQTYLNLRARYDRLLPEQVKPADRRQYDTYQNAKKQFLQRYQAGQAKRTIFTDTTRFWQIARAIQQQLPDSATTQQAIRGVSLPTDSLAPVVRNLLADTYFPQYGPFGAYLTILRLNWSRFRFIVNNDTDIAFNPDYHPQQSVGDNPADLTERYYGSPTMKLPKGSDLAVHGSHVAGIIGAQRSNGLGIDGIADNVRIMSVAVVPANGDERDKDVANGIRYAVENGAKVINMSFGKRLSPFKEQVDAAVRFAEERDVLIVLAAGNNGQNTDTLRTYPSARYADGNVARNVLVVGNSAPPLTDKLVSRSSNYGTQTVDLFAPGTEILSTIPGNRYARFSGTSMAAPCAAGVAALIRSYFPSLTAVQVRTLLMESSYKPTLLVNKPGRANLRVPFGSLSRSGGLLNAYEAVKLAQRLTARK
ncbi:S8 family serine peptidase [Spirosoma sp. KUDC1026]|uniref:S8 family serine peptidase n=1 Tax=Spirosoma sp. KUDC1026 TaxID=2745947 RepID=UPI00159BB0E0|nr:S8 family serine peptidase [Spirosoma sp. KUDC1026]QKZ12646.1 S8 family serine peptidase [Spirosoma sp. KUDC1026]